MRLANQKLNKFLIVPTYLSDAIHMTVSADRITADTDTPADTQIRAQMKEAG